MEPKPFPQDVFEYLRLHHVVTLGTSSFTGIPHADTVVFTNDEWRLFFSAGDDSAMLKNVRANRYASFTIDDYTTDWRKVRELQGVGRCSDATAEEANWARSLASQSLDLDSPIHPEPFSVSSPSRCISWTTTTQALRPSP